MQGIAEHRTSLGERNTMLLLVTQVLLRIPLELHPESIATVRGPD